MAKKADSTAVTPSRGYDACQVANWFINRAKEQGRELALAAMLKLIYIAHGWHLAIYEKPLYWNETLVWRRGPVVPDVYDIFTEQGPYVKNTVNIKSRYFSQETKDLLEKVYVTYGDYDSTHLSDITHVEDSPWDLALKSGGPYAIIPDGSIKRHYELMRLQNEMKRKQSARA